MLGPIVLALGCQLGASLLLLFGMVQRDHRLLRCGTGLLVILMVGLIGWAIAEGDPLLPDLPPCSQHWFK